MLGDVRRIKERLLDAVEPDYVVKLRNGLMVLLEMKGAEFDMDYAKYQATRRWVSAVNTCARSITTWSSESVDKTLRSLIEIIPSKKRVK